jgi:hypothetical protein
VIEGGGELFVRFELFDEDESDRRSEDALEDELSMDLAVCDDWVSEETMEELKRSDEAEDLVLAVVLVVVVVSTDEFGDEV